MNQFSEAKMFYESLKNLPDVTDDLELKRAEVKKKVGSFNDSLQKLTVDKELIKRNKDLGRLLTATIEQIKGSGDSWVSNYQKIEEREKFRSELASYFIVIIFGKVKAGKSSLGNFIAKQKLSNQDVEFFKYDEAGKEVSVNKLEEVEQDSFATDNLECTAEIQGFKLDRLAWIDTPGLGSMTKENGDLAKEYIQAADYIIYPTSSDSPLQQDETNQLKELFAQNKKVTICITKSDNSEEDECECGSENGCEECEDGITKVLINKGTSNRTRQEDWVKQEVQRIMDNEKKKSLLGEVFSLSVHAAKQGIEEGNQELYEESNLPVFYRQVTSVLKDNAVTFKYATPYDGLKAFINKDILGLEGDGLNSIKVIKDSLSDLDSKVNESLERFEALKKNTQNDVQTIVDEVLTKYSSEIDKTNVNEKIDQIDNKINIQITKELQGNITEIFSGFEASLDQFTDSLSNSEFEIKDKYRDVSYTTSTRNKKIGGVLLASFATVGVAFATGGSSLLFQGAAAIVAGGVGKYAGEAVGEVTGSQKTTRVNIGDNKEKVLQEFKKNRHLHYANSVNATYKRLQDDFFTPLKDISKKIAIDIQSFENELTHFRDQLYANK